MVDTTYPNSSKKRLSQEKVQELLLLYNNNQFEKVLSKIETLKELFNKTAELFNLEGASNASLQRYMAAIDSYKRAIELKPNYDEAYNNMGNALKGTGDIKGAIESYKQAIKINSTCEEAHYNLAVSQNEVGEFSDAANHSRHFIELNPNSAEAYYLLGNSLSDRDLKAAIQNCKHALKIRPNYVQAHNEISYCLRHYISARNNNLLGEIEAIEDLIKTEQQKLREKIDKDNFWFVDIPKTSSTAINVLLGLKFGWPFGKNTYLDSNGNHKIHINRSMLLADHTPAFIAKPHISETLWNKIDTFAVVRNPYRWCSSLWHHTMKYHNLGVKTNDFDQFLGALEERLKGDFTKREIYPTSYRQTDFILDVNGNRIVKYLFHLEDREAIDHFLRFKGVFGYSNTHRIKFGNETQSADHHIRLCEKRKIDRIFEKDFEILGY